VVGDANQLIQVFLNLVTNAEQAIREVRESGRIQIRFADLGARVSVTFQDDGIGIRPESIPRLFDPFYTTKRPGGGTGLGLSICLSIVREHGGTIDASPLPAGGSAFTVYFPAAQTQTPAPASAAAPAAVSAPAPVPTLELLNGRSILVLDDEESLLQLLQEGLSARGLQVDCAATLEEALAYLAQRSYDVLLCDLNLSNNGGVASGKAAAGQLLSVSGDRKPELVFMSGELIESSSEPVRSGEPHHLQKPFRISDVLTLLLEIFSADKTERTSD
jgi:CheY-like chemotaxis protein